MKRVIILATVCLLVSGAAYYALAAEKEKPKAEKAPEKSMASGKDVTVTGHLSCTFCKLANPTMSCKPECDTACVKAGDPPLLTDAEGNMFILINSEQGIALMTPERMKMLSTEVTVKGMLVKGKGVQAIYVNSMEKAEAKPAK